MNLRTTVALGLLAVGLAWVPAARAADEPASEPPKTEQPGNGQPKAGPKPEQPPADRPVGQRIAAAMLERFHAAVGEVKLTDEQKAQVEAAFEKATKELTALAADAAGEGRERFQKFTQVVTDLREAVRGLLTEEQRKELESKIPPGGLSAGGGRLLALLRQRLDGLTLTDEQKAKVDAAFKEAQDRIEAIRKDAAGDLQAIREKVQPVYEELQKKVQELLTPAQKEKMDKLRQEGGAGGAGGRREPL